MHKKSAPKLQPVDPKIAAAQAHLAQARNTIMRLAKAVYSRDLIIARREGYIERVQEVEATRQSPAAAGSEVQETLNRYLSPRIQDGIRDCLADGTEAEASRLLDQLDPDVLDTVLGRPGVRD